jgi:hypothetical protein
MGRVLSVDLKIEGSESGVRVITMNVRVLLPSTGGPERCSCPVFKYTQNQPHIQFGTLCDV